MGKAIDMASKIRRTVSSVHGFMRFLRAEPGFARKLISLKRTKKKIVVLGTPIHGNVGDHLIAEAERSFFQERFSDYRYIDCTMPFSRYFFKSILYSMRPEDCLMISGGGWLGSEWREHEIFVRKIVGGMKKGRLVILPQTVFYKAYDDFAKAGAAIYQSCKGLLFCVRDRASYDALIDHGFCQPSNAYLMPDFGLYGHDAGNGFARKECVNVCLRDDIEASLDDAMRGRLLEAIRKTGLEWRQVSTNTRGLLIKPARRSEAIRNKIREIAGCRLLVTDRLHAMIMAAVSGTPCIAFDNATHKVAGVYKWIAHLQYVHLYAPGDPLEEIMRRLIDSREDSRKYDDTPLAPFYEGLERRIRKLLNEH